MENGICKTCKQPFQYWPYVVKKGGGQYCSMKCRRTGKTLKCLTCGKSFYVSPTVLRLGAKFCSNECRKTSLKVFCQVCDKPILVQPHRFKSGRGKFCSRECAGKAVIGKEARHWKGGKHLDGHGYERSWTGRNARSPSHRLIAEKLLGRKLTKKEVIHHINGVKSDNRPENLYLFPNNSEHLLYHRAFERGEAELLVSNL